MPILFTCPHCGTETDVDEVHAGRTGPCAICGKPITVPYLLAAPVDAPPLPAPSPFPGRRPAWMSALMVTLGVAVVVVAAIFLGGMLLAISMPAVRAARDAALRAECSSNLRTITLALNAYAEEYGTFPPAYIADANGKPMHSWRVLILPFLDEAGLYAQYNFQEPWDGPTNVALNGQMPTVFACPADPDSQGLGETCYMVVVGSKTVFPGGTAVSRDDIIDSLSDTLLVVETPAAGVSWLDPRDLSDLKISFAIGARGGEAGSLHVDGTHVGTADGEVHFLPSSFPSEYLRALSTRDGGEYVPWRDLAR